MTPISGSVWLTTELPLFIDQLGRWEVTLIGAIFLLVLLVLSGFFSSAEIAMFKLPKHRLESLLQDEVPGASRVHRLKEDPHRLLVTILVGNNIVNVAMSSLATALLALWVSQAASVAIVTFGVTAVVLLFGESAPKSYAVENTESWALRVSRPLQLTERLLLPFVVVFDRLTRTVNRVIGGSATLESQYVSRSDIVDLIETGEREGVIDEEEHELLRRIFRFNQTIAKEVMTPRLDMTAVSADSSLEEVIQTTIQSGHARLPVYESSLDNVVGIVHVRDVLRDYLYGESDPEEMEVKELIEPTLHVPESKSVDELLTEMRERRLHMVIVIDEFGTTEGLLTMEDIVEEIVGEILTREEDRPIKLIDERTGIFHGEVNIDEVNEALDIDLPEGEEFETIAGFIFNRAGRLVDEGETIDYDGIEITVQSVDNTRILEVLISVAPAEREE